MCPPALEKLQEIHALPGEAFQPKSGALVFFGWLSTSSGLYNVGPQTISKLVHITGLTMVYGGYNYSERDF